MKNIHNLTLLTVLFLFGCGGSSYNSGNGGGGGNPPQYPNVQGKWTFSATSTQNSSTSVALFDLTNTGGGQFNSIAAMICDITPTAACIGSLIGNGTVTAQGTVQTSGAVSVNVVQTPSGGTPCTLTVTGTVSGSTMTGTYSGCQDAGTFTGSTSTSSTGSYSGSLNSTINPSVIPTSFTASVTEASDFTLTATASLTNSVCFSSLNFTSPSIAIGEALFLEDTTHGIYVIGLPSLPSPNLFYAVTNTQFCGSDQGQGTITKN